MSVMYKKSEQLLQRVLNTIPLGSQTFSKSKQQFPYGASPYFIDKGKGSRVWDVDGNEYLDFVNGLLSVSLGYKDPDVDKAVKRQMGKGVSFSLPSILEMQVAEKVVEMMPCAEMVRFGKNGSDATAGAVRLARAFTKRNHVAVCGYHGWQDWYIGSTTRNLGVPEETQKMTHRFTYNDLESLEAIFQENKGQVAAVILEPMNIDWPKKGFLEGVKDVTHKNGAVLIFDEIITGFRFAKGGAQELFGVIPDLVATGKGMANGYPISVIAGKKEIMNLMTEIFFSFTFGGEAISLAAALATLTKIQEKPVVAQLKKHGELLLKGVDSLLKKHNLQDYISISGHPCWTILSFKDTGKYSGLDIKTLWMQEILERGILSLGTHNMSYAHNERDIEQLLAVYEEVFPIIEKSIMAGTLDKFLHCDRLQHLFKVR